MINSPPVPAPSAYPPVGPLLPRLSWGDPPSLRALSRGHGTRFTRVRRGDCARGVERRCRRILLPADAVNDDSRRYWRRVRSTWRRSATIWAIFPSRTPPRRNCYLRIHTRAPDTGRSSPLRKWSRSGGDDTPAALSGRGEGWPSASRSPGPPLLNVGDDPGRDHRGVGLRE